MANFTFSKRKTLYFGGMRVDAFGVTVTADNTMNMARLHKATSGMSMVPLCVTTGNAEGIVTYTDATAFGSGGTTTYVLLTVSQTANTEQFLLMAWGF